MSFPKFGPKQKDHPSIGEICEVCGKPFKQGDYTTLVMKRPASHEDAVKMRAGKPYTAEAIEVHYDCAPIYE